LSGSSRSQEQGFLSPSRASSLDSASCRTIPGGGGRKRELKGSLSGAAHGMVSHCWVSSLDGSIHEFRPLPPLLFRSWGSVYQSWSHLGRWATGIDHRSPFKVQGWSTTAFLSSVLRIKSKFSECLPWYSVRLSRLMFCSDTFAVQNCVDGTACQAWSGELKVGRK
jgi:hypothetical protein